MLIEWDDTCKVVKQMSYKTYVNWLLFNEFLEIPSLACESLHLSLIDNHYEYSDLHNAELSLRHQ